MVKDGEDWHKRWTWKLRSNGDNKFLDLQLAKDLTPTCFPVATSTISIYKVLYNWPKETKDKGHNNFPNL